VLILFGLGFKALISGGLPGLGLAGSWLDPFAVPSIFLVYQAGGFDSAGCGRELWQWNEWFTGMFTDWALDGVE
jgi:hypothetical protein